MSLTSWSEPSLCRNILALDPFQRHARRTLAQTGRAVRLYAALHTAIEANTVRASLGFPIDEAA